MKPNTKPSTKVNGAKQSLPVGTARRLRGPPFLGPRAEWFEQVFAFAGDAMLVHDLGGRFMDLNRAAGQMLGYTREELFALREWDLVPGSSRADSVSLWAELRPGIPVVVERVYQCKGGSLMAAAARLTRFEADGRGWVVVSCRDETARNRLEDKLRASERLARGQVEALRQALDALAEEPALDTLLGRILRFLSRRLGAAGASLWLRDETTGLPVFHIAFQGGRICTRPDADHPVREDPAYWQDNPMGQEMLRTKRAVVCEDVQRDPRFAAQRRYFRAQCIRTLLAVPLLLAGRVIGLASIRCNRPHLYRAEEIELAQALAHQATLTIQLTRLMEQSQ
ncbi:MAG: GAF domain-containing protein [Verrucomicrobia bacterium]|nr:GAF domain-containing protein [Verrucomicrobiota bacterium]